MKCVVYLSLLASHVFFLALLRSSFQFAVCISHDVASLALILPYLAYILFHCLWFCNTFLAVLVFGVCCNIRRGCVPLFPFFLLCSFDFLLSWYLVALCHAA